jgi:hypothetical protein
MGAHADVALRPAMGLVGNRDGRFLEAIRIGRRCFSFGHGIEIVIAWARGLDEDVGGVKTPLVRKAGIGHERAVVGRRVDPDLVQTLGDRPHPRLYPFGPLENAALFVNRLAGQRLDKTAVNTICVVDQVDAQAVLCRRQGAGEKHVPGRCHPCCSTAPARPGRPDRSHRSPAADAPARADRAGRSILDLQRRRNEGLAVDHGRPPLQGHLETPAHLDQPLHAVQNLAAFVTREISSR